MCDADINSEKERLRLTVEEALRFAEGNDIQIAFFGGSFTGIEPKRMIALLETAYEYVKNGSVQGIRLSTRPDYISEDIISLLLKYGVTNIELGMQSTDNKVLVASGRGHDRQVCFDSAKMIVESGIKLGGQMMIGLPLSTLEKEVQTAKDIISMGATEARIYPTVVFADTELYDMAISGRYIPINNEAAVERSAECLELFRDNAIKVLRVGLHASDELSNAPFGANHPSIGELVYSRLAYKDIIKSIDNVDVSGKKLSIYVPKGTESIVSGQKAENKRKLAELYKCKRIKIFGCGTEKIRVKIEAEG